MASGDLEGSFLAIMLHFGPIREYQYMITLSSSPRNAVRFTSGERKCTHLSRHCFDERVFTCLRMTSQERRPRAAPTASRSASSSSFFQGPLVKDGSRTFVYR